jgi:aminoglycoside phosphotransferase family enzyme/predicted kinase
MSRPILPDALQDPEAWPQPQPRHVELIETHVSWVLRGEAEVFKIKKPVDLGFVDFRSPERRRAACEAEVRLNARLAPGVYLGVVPVVRRSDARLALSGEGEGVDWAVRMRRLDDAARADTLLSRGALGQAEVEAIATTVAAFHARHAVTPAEGAAASAAAIERNVKDNFDQIRTVAGLLVGPDVARTVEERQRAFVRDHAAWIDARLAHHVCDGHGDLRLEHVYFESDGLRIIDCIEFDERYRIADACADVAFLAMDLTNAGRPELAERFLAAYARAAQDYDLYAAVDFYESYRAWIRGKVSAMLAGDATADDEARLRAERTARRHFLLAQALETPSVVGPTLICVGGVIASGKSTFAEALSSELSCPVVDTDRTRKHMLGVGESDPLRDPEWRGAYDPAVTARVYDEALRRASVVLASGRSVVVDASFRSAALRQRARELARARGSGFLFVRCLAPESVCLERLARRRSGPSDGRAAIFGAFVASFEPVSELPAELLEEVDTAGPAALAVERIRERVTSWPRGLT